MIDVGTVLADRYRLGSRIAGGGMGDVWAAEDTRLEREVAVKVLRGGGAPSDLHRFEGEIRTLARLNHPSIVGLHDAGDHDGTPFLVMELVDGHSLVDVIREAPHDPEVARQVGISVADALAYAHARGIVHRDVKPANVLLDVEGRARLADFGIARLADVTGLTTTGSAVGTAAYLAPEQLSDDPVGPPADVYALGLVLLEVVTGERAFQGTTVETAFARLSRDPKIPDAVPEGWRMLLRAMTARDATSRPAAEEVATLLREGPTLEATRRIALAPTVPLAADEPTTPIPDAGPTVPLEGRAHDRTAALPPTAEREVADEPPVTPRERRPRRPVAAWLVLLVLGAVALAAVILTTLSDDAGLGEAPAPAGTTTPGNDQPTGGGGDPPGDDDLPSPLEDVFNRLEDSVSG